MAKSEQNGLAVSPRPKKTAHRATPQIIYAVTVPVTAVLRKKKKKTFRLLEKSLVALRSQGKRPVRLLVSLWVRLQGN